MRKVQFFHLFIVLQIVPPEQSEKMYDAVKDNGVPVAYKVFEGSVFNVTVD